MPKNILRFSIFISCPGDVEAEKDRLFEFFASAEKALTKKGIPGNLVPLYWKNIVHQYDGVRGQTVINKEFDEYDHYIGILAARFGTPTTTETGITYGSGTEEEFRIAVKKKKDNPDLGLYFFFKNVPKPTEPEKLTEYDKVINFKYDLYPDGWVNSFTDPTNLTDKLSEDLIPIIEETIRNNQTKEVSKFIAEAEVKEVETPDGTATALTTLTDDLRVVEIEHPITRTVTVEEDDEISRLLFSEDYKKDLIELVTDHNRIVVLGNAGSGKSTELAKLVEYYQQPGSLFVPIFSSLNIYKGGPMSKFLPEEFSNVPENTALIVLDGLDEVETEYFNEALDEIENLISEFPLCKVIISCRTNFFEISSGAMNGYLQEFAITRMNEITPAAIVQALNANGLDGEAFYKEVLDAEYQSIITKPFFLNILTAVYRKQHHLHGGRAQVFAEAIRLKLESAAKKENLSGDDLERCEQLLIRLALVMEYMGRNYLTNDEFIEIIAAENDRGIIEKSLLVTLFKGRWSFEHNNIQEYFAARALSPLAVDQVKALVAFYPDFKQIKPSWLNTLAFLISIIADDKRQQLLDWIIENEPETMIRFEADRIDVNIRYRVFSAIFKDFQGNDLPIRSNKFTEAELGHFGDTPQSLEIVIEAISRIGNTVSNKITALRLLEFFKLETDEEKLSVKRAILQFIAQNEDKSDAVYSAVHVLVRCKLSDQQTVGELIARYREQKDPYYRAALYTLITRTGNTDQYIDVFLEGILIIGNRNPQEQKSTLWDETAQLKKSLEAVKEPKAIDKALEFLGEPYDERYRYYSDKREVLESLIKRATAMFPEANYLYDRILSVFINYSKTSDRDVLNNIRSFFEETGTLTTAFITVFNEPDLPKFQKNHLLSIILNAESIDYIITEALAGRVQHDQIKKFAEEAYYHTRHTNQSQASLELKQQLEQKLSISFDDEIVEKRQAMRRQQKQESFDLLFDEEGMKAETERFWQAFGKDEASWNEIWEFSNSAEYNLEPYYPRSVTSMISELSRGRGFISKPEVEAFMANVGDFEFERIDSIYNLMKNNGMKVSEQQSAYLEDWANREAAKYDIKQSINAYGQYNPISLMIWFFVKTLQIKLPQDKLLDFTLFYDFINGNIEDWYSPILQQVSEEALNARVIENLKSEIARENVWVLNAEYAIEKGLSASFDAIKLDLVRINEITSVKEKITKLYLEATDDQEGMYEVLLQLQSQDYRWELVDILLKGRLIKEMHHYLRDVLDSNANAEDKLAAAKRLTAMADEVGFNYYVDHGFKKPGMVYRDDLWLSYLSNLKSLNFLPRLIGLLDQSLLPENTRDSFTRYDGKVLDALFSMGIQSIDNLKAVTTAVEGKIAQHAPAWNYLIPWLKQMDFQYKLNLSSDVSLVTAVGAVNALGYV
jgi:hypothetical protein